MRDAGPRVLGGRAQHLEDLVELIVGAVHARERRHSRQHLHEDAADAPHVQRRRVFGRAEQHVRRPVPQRHHFVRVRVRRHRFRSRQPEIRQLQFTDLAD